MLRARRRRCCRRFARATAEEKPALLLEAVGLWEQAGEKSEALEVIERIAIRDARGADPRGAGRALPAARRLRRAVDVGFAPAMAAGD